MRRLVILGILAGALAQPAAAGAGCWATVGLAPPPEGIGAGETWTAQMTVLQHGRTPLPDAADAKPRLTIVSEKTGERRTFVARGTADPTVFEAEVVFPAAGAWRYEVFDGFTSWNGEPAPCAQTHTFTAVSVGGGGGSGGAPPAKGKPAAAQSPAPAKPAASAPSPAAPAPAASTSDGGGSGFPLWPALGAVAGALAAAAGATVVVLRRRNGRPATTALP